MGVSNPAVYFRPYHAVACVLLLSNHSRINRSSEAGPSAAGVVFVPRRKQRFPRSNIDIDSLSLAVIKFVAESAEEKYILENNSPATHAELITALGKLTEVDIEGYFENRFAEGNGQFIPDTPITREQLATLIKQFADALGKGPRGAWAIRLDYADLEEVSDWAFEGVMFCTLR